MSTALRSLILGATVFKYSRTSSTAPNRAQMERATHLMIREKIIKQLDTGRALNVITDKNLRKCDYSVFNDSKSPRITHHIMILHSEVTSIDRRAMFPHNQREHRPIRGNFDRAFISK
jgi:hypothetical protein